MGGACSWPNKVQTHSEARQQPAAPRLVFVSSTADSSLAGTARSSISSQSPAGTAPRSPGPRTSAPSPLLPPPPSPLLPAPKPPAVIHLTADFLGASPLQLTDQSLISGLVVSAAGAAGMQSSGAPVVLKHPDGGLSVILPLDGCHCSLHTLPTQEVAILDVLARPPHDPQMALDVVVRRLQARTVSTERRERG